MQTQAKQHDAKSAKLRKQAKELVTEADRRVKVAKALEAEAGKLADLQKLVGSLSPDILDLTPPKKAAVAAAAPKKEAPAKDPAMKAAPKTAPAAAKEAAPEPAKEKKAAPPEFVTYADHVFPIFEAMCNTGCGSGSDRALDSARRVREILIAKCGIIINQKR